MNHALLMLLSAETNVTPMMHWAFLPSFHSLCAIDFCLSYILYFVFCSFLFLYTHWLPLPEPVSAGSLPVKKEFFFPTVTN